MKFPSVKNLSEIIKHLNGVKKIDSHYVDIDAIFNSNICHTFDFADVKGQENVKRAMKVAASGGHSCIHAYQF